MGLCPMQGYVHIAGTCACSIHVPDLVECTPEGAWRYQHVPDEADVPPGGDLGMVYFENDSIDLSVTKLRCRPLSLGSARAGSTGGG